MPRPALLCVALVLVAGCSGADESDSALEPGQVVVVSKPDGVRLDSDAGYPKLEPGVTLRVGHDPGEVVQSPTSFDDDVKAARTSAEADEIRRRGPYRFKPGDKGPQGQPMSGGRHVKVTVETGQHAGASGEVRREDVRPIP